jgi:hypothetical protein
MPRKVTIAAVQMDVTPAPTAERLERAGRLVTEAAAAGAKLIVLPELFNTGYGYSDANHYRAEAMDGQTVAWMRRLATRLDVHLAGSLLLLDEDEVYNALLLVAPDGRNWRYDKIYPWGWERGYFRNGRDITVADTELGRIGMLVCWDVAHAELWRRYAGRVDLMLISSCPPNVTQPVYHLPGGEQLAAGDMGLAMATMQGVAGRTFGEALNEQVRWLNVPAVHTTASGRFRSPLPAALGTMLAMAPMAPRLLKHLPQADQLEMACDMVPECKVLDADGRVLSKLSNLHGEAFAIAEVVVGDRPPAPRGKQPALGLPLLAYLFSDYIGPWLTIGTYRRGLRRAWGEQMAPVDPATRQWSVVVGLGVMMGFVMGWLVGRKR